MPSSRGSSKPRDWTKVSCIEGRFFTIWATREAQQIYNFFKIREVETHTDKKGRDWRDVDTSQGHHGTAGNHQKLEEAWRILPWSFQREPVPADT